MEVMMSNVPKLRFSGFVDSWETHKLNELAETVTSGSRDWAQFYSDSGDKFIRMTNLQRDSIRLNLSDLKYVDLGASRSEGTRTSLQAGDILFSITAELGKIGWVDELLGTAYINQHTALIRLIAGKSNSKFVAMLLQTERMNKRINRLNDSGAKAGLNLPTIRSIPVVLPTGAEQQKIASFLTAVDTKIEQLTQKESLLKKYKKGVMQKIFSQEIRFKADDGSEFPEWVESKLGEVTEKISVKNKDAFPYPVYSISNKHGFVPQDEQFDGVDSAARNYDISMYQIVGEKTFAYNPARINVGSIGYSGELKDIIVSSLYVCFQTSGELDDAFFKQYLMTFDFKKNVLRNVEGGVRDYLFYENFSAIKFRFPSLNEQKKICEVLESLDNKIKYIHKELAFTQNFKKGLLQQMFV